jgi:hypothetical protein
MPVQGLGTVSLTKADALPDSKAAAVLFIDSRSTLPCSAVLECSYARAHRQYHTVVPQYSTGAPVRVVVRLAAVALMWSACLPNLAVARVTYIRLFDVFTRFVATDSCYDSGTTGLGTWCLP